MPWRRVVTLDYSSWLWLLFACASAHSEVCPRSHNLALHLIQLSQRGSSQDRHDCLLLWFCSIILFPLLVVTYLSFIKTKWVRFQPSSINCHPSRKPKSTIFFLLSLSILLPFLCPYFHLLLFVLSFLPLFLPCSLLLSGEREESYHSLISSWESAVWGPSQCDFVVYSVSRHLRGRPSVCVESGRGDWIAWVASRRKIKEREKKKIKEKKRGRVIFHNKRNSNMVIWCP